MGGQWHAVCLWVMKIHQEFIKGGQDTKDYIELICKTLGEIVCLEENMVSDLADILNPAIGMKTATKPVRQYHVNLPYNAKSHLCGLNIESHRPQELFLVGRSLKTSRCEFEIQREDKNGNNVMVLEGQDIILNKKAKNVFFLGCALWGNQTGEFEVYFNEGESQKKQVFVSDWNEKKYLEEEVVWETVFEAKTSDVENYKAKVVQFGLFMEKNDWIDKIRMPDGGKIHIFAMTLLEE